MYARAVTVDSLLVIRSYNSLSGLVLTIVGRVLDEHGLIRSFEFQHTPNTDRSEAEETSALIAGTLLDVAVIPKTGTPRRGQCWVTIGLALRNQPTTVYYQMLAKGYVTAAGGVLWPGGAYLDSVDGPGILRSVAGTDPAAGIEVIEAVPTNARWRVRSLRAALVTAVTAATRTVGLVIDDATTTFLAFTSGTTQIASLTRTYNVGDFGFLPTAVGGDIYFCLPEQPHLFQGWRIRTSTTNLQAGDNWGAPQMEIEEWIEE